MRKRTLMKFHCWVCGERREVYREHFPVHCVCGYVQRDPSMGWGDRLAAILTKVGITKFLYARVKAFFRLKPKCGCNKRQQDLNTFGAQLKSLVRYLSGSH